MDRFGPGLAQSGCSAGDGSFLEKIAQGNGNGARDVSDQNNDFESHLKLLEAYSMDFINWYSKNLR